MNKYIGKPRREIIVNLAEFDNSKSIEQIMNELSRQDRLHNCLMNKSYAFEVKWYEI